MVTVSLHWPFLGWRRERVSVRSAGWTALVICVLAGSTYNVFAKILTGSLSPLTLLVVSEMLTAFFVLFSFGIMPVIRDLLRLPARDYLPLFFIGVMSGTVAPILLFSGLQMSTAVNASLFANMEPVFLVLLAVILLHERFGRSHLLSALAISAGVVVIGLRGFTEGLHLNVGDGLLILSSLSFAAGSITFRRNLHRVEPHLVLFSRTAVAVTCFFVLSPFLRHPLIDEIVSFPVSALPILIGFGFVSRFLNVFSFYEALDCLPVTTVSLVCNTGVITSILFAWWVLGEPIEVYHIVGGALIILGTLLLELAGWHRNPQVMEKHHRTRGPRG